MSEPLEFTGERFTPECVREIRYEHFHRYAFARGLVGGRRVLDAACGEGYGAAWLAESASAVTGVDLSAEAIGHAQARYRSANLDFRVADCLDLPFPDGAFDSVVSFETLEHLEDQEGLLAEFRRVLRTGGFLVISSPDREVYAGEGDQPNPYHERELDRGEFEALLARHFPVCRLWGQKLLFQSAIWSLDARPGTSLLQDSGREIIETPVPRYDPVYLIAICAARASDLPNQAAGLSLFGDREESVYRHYYQEIRKNMAAGAVLENKERELEELRSRLADVRSPGRWWRRWFGRR